MSTLIQSGGRRRALAIVLPAAFTVALACGESRRESRGQDGAAGASATLAGSGASGGTSSAGTGPSGGAGRGGTGPSGGSGAAFAGSLSAGGVAGIGGSAAGRGPLLFGGGAPSGTSSEDCPPVYPQGTSCAGAPTQCTYDGLTGCLCLSWKGSCTEDDPRCSENGGAGGAADAPVNLGGGLRVCDCRADGWGCNLQGL